MPTSHAVVAESVVVIKKLLQTQPSEHKDIIIHMAKLVDFITVPQARASILWLLGEYSDRVPKIAPDVLRKMAKVFVDEEDIVKLQILNLAVKLFLTNPKQTKLLSQYVFSLARYDQNYDIRDRARFLRQFIFPSEGSKLARHAKKIFLATKPAPVLASKFKDREHFQMGSLSHYINARATGYNDLPQFPETPLDSSVRDVETIVPVVETRTKKPHAVKKRSFYSESEQSSPDDDSENSNDDEEDEDEDGSNESSEEDDSTEEDSDSDSEDSDNEQTEEEKKNKKNTAALKSSQKGKSKKETKISPDSESAEDEESSSEDESDTPESESSMSSEQEQKTKPPAKKTSVKSTPVAAMTPKPKSNLDLLLELDDVPPTITPVMTPSLGGLLTPLTSPVVSMSIQPTSASYIPLIPTELVNKMAGGGLSVSSRFTRSPHLFSPAMVSIELTFTNLGTDDITDIKVGSKVRSPGYRLNCAR
ncbi:unnamed protein product, partial [Timema podura]|nr:unnamed protein product [Timema podura]